MVLLSNPLPGLGLSPDESLKLNRHVLALTPHVTFQEWHTVPPLFDP